MRHAWLVLLLAGCSDPAPAAQAGPEINGEGVRVHVGGREVVVHCAITCDAMTHEMSRISDDCTNDVSSRPHLLATSTGIISLGCCQEAAAAYEHGCGHEGLAACMVGWSSECEGTAFHAPASGTDEVPQRGVPR